MTPGKRALLFIGLKFAQMVLVVAALETASGYTNLPAWVSLILWFGVAVIVIGSIVVGPIVERK
jgi:hypothetical protein